MGEIIFILGGARSGKSSFAVDIAKRLKGEVAYIATSDPIDDEMKERIKKHKDSRPKGWKTVEAPYNLLDLISLVDGNIIIDCITVFLSNLIIRGNKEEDILKDISRLISNLKRRNGISIIVSNEIGMSIVPDNYLSRLFRDIAGAANRMIAKEADTVYFMIAGIPIKIKGGNR
jgi:adenosylcobinamide kinase/adenosylcobinamide-phosphate guanylyltransferase